MNYSDFLMLRNGECVFDFLEFFRLFYAVSFL